VSIFWWRHLSEAKQSRDEAAEELKESRKTRVYVEDLAGRDQLSVRRNHFGEAIEIAMGIRRSP
jgi:hypothetical protein